MISEKLQLKSGLASRVGHCGDSAVIPIRATVETGSMDTRLLSSFGNLLANQFRCLGVTTVGHLV